MKKVYIVTDGAYSDYGICGVFDDEALAEQFQELFAPRGQVEAWDLNPYEREIRADYRLYQVVIHRDGTVWSVGRHDEDARYFVSRDEIEPCLWLKLPEGHLHTHVLAADEAHAVKVANERRVAYLAAEEHPGARRGK